MEPKGSITIFFTLLLSIVISLIGTLLLSVKVAAGRTQIATAVDQAMFSAMAKYDRALFEEYHLLYIDGSYGTGTLQLGKALDEIESDMSYLLTPNKEREIMGGKNLLQLERMSGSITGYTLATDCEGSVFYEQAVSYMEKTLGLQGISFLSQKLISESNTIQSQENTRQNIEMQGNLEDYESIKEEAARMASVSEGSGATGDGISGGSGTLEDGGTSGESGTLEDGGTSGESGTLEDGGTSGGNGTSGEHRVTEEQKKLAKQAENAIDTISILKRNSLMRTVLPNPQAVSGWTGDWNQLYRNRNIPSGMGYLELTRSANALTDDLLFQEYLMQNLNYYGMERHSTGPAYGVEWVLFEKASDIENLETTINRLMLIREAANAVSLRQDGSRYGQIQTMAEALAAVLKLPGIQVVLEGIILLTWAYAESIVDVRGLMEGETIPLVKTSNSWQVEFLEILPAIQHPEEYYKESSGLSYGDYLRVFLLTKSREGKIAGAIEVIEASMRELPGKEFFMMDCAIDALETEFEIRAQNLVTFTICEKRSYRTM